MKLDPDQTRKLLVLVGGICVYVAQELIPGAPQPRPIPARTRRA